VVERFPSIEPFAQGVLDVGDGGEEMTIHLLEATNQFAPRQ